MDVRCLYQRIDVGSACPAAASEASESVLECDGRAPAVVIEYGPTVR